MGGRGRIERKLIFVARQFVVTKRGRQGIDRQALDKRARYRCEKSIIEPRQIVNVGREPLH